jgi:tetratricopeptide (TPR) repeat protein
VSTASTAASPPSPVFRLRWILTAGVALIVISATVSYGRSRAGADYRLRHLDPSALERLAAQRPNDASVQRSWAEQLAGLGRLEEANRVFRAAVNSDPTDVRSWTGWGRANLALGRVEVALEILKKAEEQWPQDFQAQFGLAGALSARGDFDGAIPHWRAGLRLHPASREAWISLGAALETQKAPVEGCQAYRRAAELEPDDLLARLGEARCLIRTGRWPEARMLLLEALKLDPSQLQARILLAETYFAEGTPDSRITGQKELGRAAAFHPEAPGPHSRMAQIWMEEGSFADAAQAYAQAADREPSNERHLRRAAEAYRRLKLDTQARAYDLHAEEVVRSKREATSLLAAANRSPQDPAPLLKRAHILEGLRLTADAAEAYRGALVLQPSNRDATVRHVSLMRQLQTQDEERQVPFSAESNPDVSSVTH